MALIGRDDVAEDRMTIEMLAEGGFGIKIEPEEVGNMTGVIWKIRNSRQDRRPGSGGKRSGKEII